VTSKPLRYIQLKVTDALARISPEGSDLDTVFWSYDDWREASEEVFACKAKKLAASVRRLAEQLLSAQKDLPTASTTPPAEPVRQ
jgi:hypothetical protein